MKWKNQIITINANVSKKKLFIILCCDDEPMRKYKYRAFVDGFFFLR